TDVRLGGLKTKITIPKPIDQDSLGNIFAANFYTGALSTAPLTEIRNTDSQATAENPHLHTRGSTDRGGNAIYITSKIPKIINPIADRSGSQINISGNDAYRVLCLDEAHEVLQQINVYIREWNTLDKYDEYVGNVNNTSPEPDVGGTEADSAADCLPFRNNRCNNDYPDLDDFPGVYPNR
ncbi:MAG: hypothetical protein HAW60_05235, partial [Bdellovibrionales bacterium]|nr:hypothetical protein [Bdellovibrionales bacterium]